MTRQDYGVDPSMVAASADQKKYRPVVVLGTGGAGWIRKIASGSLLAAWESEG